MTREQVYRAALERIRALPIWGPHRTIAYDAITAADALPARSSDEAKFIFRRAYLDWADWGKESRQLSLGALDAAFEALDAHRRAARP